MLLVGIILTIIVEVLVVRTASPPSRIFALCALWATLLVVATAFESLILDSAINARVGRAKPGRVKPGIDSEERAQALFQRLLKPEQREEWRKRGLVTVPLGNGQSAQIGSGSVNWQGHPGLYSQCVGPNMMKFGAMPRSDIFVAQLLYLRNNPNGVRAVSNLPPLDGSGPVGRAPYSPYRRHYFEG